MENSKIHELSDLIRKQEGLKSKINTFSKVTLGDLTDKMNVPLQDIALWGSTHNREGVIFRGSDVQPEDLYVMNRHILDRFKMKLTALNVQIENIKLEIFK